MVDSSEHGADGLSAEAAPRLLGGGRLLEGYYEPGHLGNLSVLADDELREWGDSFVRARRCSLAEANARTSAMARDAMRRRLRGGP